MPPATHLLIIMIPHLKLSHMISNWCCRYVSLFPLLMRLLPPKSKELTAQLKQLKSSQILSKHGIQSLSSSSSLYAKRNTEHDPPYWRGPIWIKRPIFLVLASLHHYSQVWPHLLLIFLHIKIANAICNDKYRYIGIRLKKSDHLISIATAGWQGKCRSL